MALKRPRVAGVGVFRRPVGLGPVWLAVPLLVGVGRGFCETCVSPRGCGGARGGGGEALGNSGEGRGWAASLWELVGGGGRPGLRIGLCICLPSFVPGSVRGHLFPLGR